LKRILKWPLIIAVIVVVLRVVTERAGAPDSLNNVLSIVVLHTILGPLYFAVQIVRYKLPRPYAELFKLITVYVFLTRLLILPVYWLARIYEWTQSRFAGLWGPRVSPFAGYIGVPFLTAAFWVVASIVFGGMIGSAVIAVAGRKKD
jgi:hypothetical protein